MSEDYMKYDGRFPEPPYRTLEGTLEELEEITAERDDLQQQLAAERARVEALCDVIYDANGIAYPFAEMQDKMTAILNAHAQGDEA